MNACFCMLALVSVFVSMSSAIDFLGFDAVNPIVIHPTPTEDQTTPMSDEGVRRKRWLPSTDRTKIINKINSLRGSVGASNMNYLTYSSSLEFDVSNWTHYCDYDATPYSNTVESVWIKYVSQYSVGLDHISILEDIFTEPKFYNLFRSVYLQDVGAALTLCFDARVEGRYYEGPVYLAAYSFSYTSYFNRNVTQFTLGKECTTCQSRSYWCDGRLCRDDCTSQIPTCLCYTSCTKCQDWNRQSCSCPSQPYSDAVALNCSNPTMPPVQPTPPPKKSGSCKPYITSWAAIIVSTLAILHLQ